MVFITSRIKGGYKVSKLLHNFFVMQEKLHKTPRFKICFLLGSYIKIPYDLLICILSKSD